MSDNVSGQSLFLDVGRDFASSSRVDAQGARSAVSPYVFVHLAMATEAAILLCAALATYVTSAGGVATSWGGLTQLGVIGLYASWIFLIAKPHRLDVIANFPRHFPQFALGWSLLAVMAIAIDAAPQIIGVQPAQPTFGIPTAHIFSLLVIWGGVLAGARYILSELFRYCVRKEIIAHDVVIFGANDPAARFVEHAAVNQLGVRVRAVFDDVVGNTAPRALAAVPLSGGIDELLIYAKRNHVSDVVVALPREDARTQELVRRLNEEPLKISMLPVTLSATMPTGYSAIQGALPGVQLVPLVHLPINFRGRLIKGTFDRLVALFALLLFSPVMIACAIGIKLSSPGSIFYRQHRIGYRNVEFSVLKFRSMHVTSCDTGKLTVRNDPRVFNFGLVMRKLSLDELPQLFNVLRGDMSLVGPRPHMPEASAAGQLYSEAVQNYSSRHKVKPGITGWAQVSGWRGPTETLHQIEQRVAYDMHYIENWSLWLDIKILVKTALVGFFGKNAF